MSGFAAFQQLHAGFKSGDAVNWGYSGFAIYACRDLALRWDLGLGLRRTMEEGDRPFDNRVITHLGVCRMRTAISGLFLAQQNLLKLRVAALTFSINVQVQLSTAREEQQTLRMVKAGWIFKQPLQDRPRSPRLWSRHRFLQPHTPKP